MLAFDIDFETQTPISPLQNKSTLARRLEQTQKSAFMPKTFTKGFFNVDNAQEYEYYNQKSNRMIQEKSMQTKSRGISQRRGSKRKSIKLESLAQTNYTQVYENYVKVQKQPQFQQFTVQKSIKDLQTQSHLYQTRRMAKRRQNKKIEIQVQTKQKPKLASQNCQQQLYFQAQCKSPTILNYLQDCSRNNDNIKSQLKHTSSQLFKKALQKHQIFEGLEQKSQQQTDQPNMKPLIDLDPQEIKNQQLTNVFEQVNTQNCLMIRDKGGFNCFWPQFHLYSDRNRKHLMSAKKTSTKPTSTFIISTSKTNFQQNSQSYLGKMKSNILGNVLNIFGPGLNPTNAQDKNVTPRQLIATVVYDIDIFRGKPKQFKVFVKKAQYSYYSDFPQVKMYEDEIPLNELNQFAENKQKIKVYQNRKAFWSNSIGGYMLNFKGKAKTASTKNFILEQAQHSSEAVLFGKIDDSNFNLDISSSISHLVAFAAALSSFDSRICD